LIVAACSWLQHTLQAGQEWSTSIPSVYSAVAGRL